MDPEIKKIQIEMKKLGLYDGPTDGVKGPATEAAIKLYERKQREDEDARAEREARAGREERDAAAKRKREDAEAAAKIASKQAAEQNERDTQTGIVQGASIGTGMLSGFGMGKVAEHFATPAAKAEMIARSAQLKNLAATIRAINPTNKDARALYKDAVGAADAGRLTKRPLPWGTVPTGSAMLGMGAYSSFDRAPNSKSDIERAIWTGTGYGEMTAGAKMLADSLRRYKNPGVAYPADDLAAVQSARRMAQGGPLTAVAPPADAPPYNPAGPGGPDAPPEAPPGKPAPNPGTRADLYQQAKARGLPVTTRTKKAELESTLSRALRNASKAAKKAPKALVPAAVGYGVYDALRSPAEAQDGQEAEPMGRAEAAAYGTGAAAATGGTIAAGQALADTRLGRALKGIGSKVAPALTGANEAFMPSTIDAMTDYSQDEVNQGRNFAARNLPSFMRAGGVEQAYQMAQVPERNQGKTDEYANARGLEIPEGIPSPRPDGSSPYDEPPQDSSLADLEAAATQDPELAEMLKQLILSRVGNAQMNQIPNAMASQAAASQPAMMAAALRNYAQR